MSGSKSGHLMRSESAVSFENDHAARGHYSEAGSLLLERRGAALEALLDLPLAKGEKDEKDKRRSFDPFATVATRETDEYEDMMRAFQTTIQFSSQSIVASGDSYQPSMEGEQNIEAPVQSAYGNPTQPAFGVSYSVDQDIETRSQSAYCNPALPVDGFPNSSKQSAYCNPSLAPAGGRFSHPKISQNPELSAYGAAVAPALVKSNSGSTHHTSLARVDVEARWSETKLDRYHILLDALRKKEESTSSRMELYEELSMLVNDFEATCEAYARCIINEAHLPPSEKTIKHLEEAHGVLGGDKFLVDHVFIKFARDQSGLMGTTYAARSSAARKVANHEIKALAAISEANIDGLRFPLLSSITYGGHTLLCMSYLPISSSTLVYGSNDGGLTVQASDERANELARKLGTKLNLKPHSPASFPNLKFYTPIDFEIHKIRGEYYCLDFSRLFPPTLVEADSPSGAHLYRLFRPEFIVSYGKPLCSDT